MGYWKLLDTASVEKDFEDDYNVIVQNAFGVGTPAHNNIIQSYALADGGVFQKTIIQPRVFTLQCATKTTTIDAWHTARKDLFAQLNRNRGATVDPVTIRYDDGTTTLDIEAYYDGGLEIGTLEKTIEKFAIRFVCPDPMWKASSSNNTSLTELTIVNSGGIMAWRDTDGTWTTDDDNAIGGGANVPIIFAEKSNGDIVLAGAGRAIKIYNGSTFSSIGTITAATEVNAVAVDAADNIYIGGTFTDVDATTARRIAKYNGATWSEPATNGFDGAVRAIAIGKNNTYIYVGGDFTADGTSAGTYRRAARFAVSGGAITELDAGLDNTAYSMDFDINGDLVIGGSFSNDGPSSTTLRKLVSYNVTTDVMTEIDGGTTGSTVFSVKNDPNTGTAVFYGSFASMQSGKVVKSLGRIGNGNVVSNLGADIDHYPNFNNTLSITSDGTIYCGDRTTDSNIFIAGADAFLREDVKCNTNTESIFVDSTKRVWICTTALTANWEHGAVTVVANNGTAPSYPTFTFTGEGDIYMITNYTSGHRLLFNDGIYLIPGEVLTIDLSPGVKTLTSSLRGNVFSQLHPSSDLAAFVLLPGNNNISMFADNTAMTSTITVTDTFWSIDGVT